MRSPIASTYYILAHRYSMLSEHSILGFTSLANVQDCSKHNTSDGRINHRAMLQISL